MHQDVFQDVLAEISRDEAKGVHRFTDDDEVEVLVAAHGSWLTIKGVTSIRVKTGYTVLTSTDGETHLMGLDHVVGIKVRRSRRAGF